VTVLKNTQNRPTIYLELSFPGVKVPGNELAEEQIGQVPIGDILVLKIILVSVFILFSGQNLYFIQF